MNANALNVAAVTAGSGLTGEYYIGNFATPVVVRSDATIKFNWTSGRPDVVIPRGLFSARWSGQIQAPTTGSYTFYTNSDSATKVIVNGVVLLDKVSNYAQGVRYPALQSGTITLTAGQQYAVQVEYVSRGVGSPRVQFLWSGPGIKKAVVPASMLFPDTTVALPPASLTATYFRTKDFTDPVLTRDDTKINFDWVNGSPDSAVIPNGSKFSVRWLGQIIAPTSGTYTFKTVADDGIRLWVNGDEIINNFHDHPATANFGTINLTAGQIYDVRVDYFEDVVNASAKLLWVPPGGTLAYVPFTAPGHSRDADQCGGHTGLII